MGIFKRGSYICWSRLRVLGYKYCRPGPRSSNPNRSLLGSGVCLDLEIVLGGRCFLALERSKSAYLNVDGEHTPCISSRKLLSPAGFG